MGVTIEPKKNAGQGGDLSSDDLKKGGTGKPEDKLADKKEGKVEGQEGAQGEGKTGNENGLEGDLNPAVTGKQLEEGKEGDLRDVGIDAKGDSPESIAARLDGGNITLDTATKTQIEGAHPSKPVSEIPELHGKSPDDLALIARDRESLREVGLLPEQRGQLAQAEERKATKDEYRLVLRKGLKRYTIGTKTFKDDEVYVVDADTASTLLGFEDNDVPVFTREKGTAKAEARRAHSLPTRKEVRTEDQPALANTLAEQPATARRIDVGSPEEEAELFGRQDDEDQDGVTL